MRRSDWRLSGLKRPGRLDRGRARGSHRSVEDELEWAAGIAKAYDRSGRTQLEVAKSLGISKGAVFQAIRTARLDPRIKDAMVEKSRTGWRARQQDVRRYSLRPIDEVLQELGAAKVSKQEVEV